jgi:thiol-disulfide isomerase/thioredoxin
MNELEQDNLGQILAENKKVFVQFGAGWCGNCRMIKPKIKNLAKDYADIAFYYVDAEKFPGAREFAEVTNLPTYATYQNAKLVKQAQGNKIETVKELIDEIANN